MSSLINVINNISIKRKFLDFSHVTEDSKNVYLNFVNEPPYLVAKKLHDGTKIYPNNGSFYELIEAIVEKESDHSISILNQIILKEVEKYNDELVEGGKPVFEQEINDKVILRDKFLGLNIFLTPTKKWQPLIFDKIDDLLDNKILRSSQPTYLKALDIKEKFVVMLDAKINAFQYLKFINQFVDNVQFDKDKLISIKDMFEQGLTFELALQLPIANPNKVLSFLFQRLDYDNKASEYKLRSFSNVEEMVKIIKELENT